MYQFKPELPFTPGNEVSGIVSAIGEGVSSYNVGDEVIGMPLHGGYAEQIKVLPNQVYKKPKRVVHPVYSSDGLVIPMEGRIRLCPYYFVDEKKQDVALRGILATLCPADKKIIHGMKDASLMPCVYSH